MDLKQTGQPAVAKDVFIAPGARVVGRVSIGTGSSVWYNAVVRGDLEQIQIGEETNLQDNATIHVEIGFPTIIGSRVTVGHGAIIHGCIIEDETLIGMGAIVMNGSLIGSGSIIAAGSLVTAGTIIPPRSLVMGSPGKVIRGLAEEELPLVKGSYITYRELARCYLKQAAPESSPAAPTSQCKGSEYF